MSTLRTAHHLAAACSLLAWATFAPTAANAQPQTGFEPSPVLAGAAIAPAALLKGPLHTVAEPISLKRYFGRFVIESTFGKFSVVGVNMLAVRVNELQAIATLQEVQKSQAFQDSLVRAASAPVQLVQSAVTNSLGTVESIGQGLGNVLGRVGFLARSTAQSVSDASSDRNNVAAPSTLPAAPAGETIPSAFTSDPFGYNKARREWAQQLNVDPYTSNPVLRPLLDNVSRASFAGSFAINTAIGALVVALAKMGGIAGVESVIQVAAQVQGETHVRFLVESVRMLGQYKGKEGRLTKLTMSNMVPVGITEAGTRSRS